MKEEIKSITVDKKKHEVKIKSYESFQELMVSESAEHILEAYNFRFAQEQCQEEKKRIKPRRLPIKEKRGLAFNLFTEEELATTTSDAGKFEDIMESKLLIIEEQIKNKEIL